MTNKPKKHYLTAEQGEMIRERIIFKIVEWSFINEGVRQQDLNAFREAFLVQLRCIVSHEVEKFTKHNNFKK